MTKFFVWAISSNRDCDFIQALLNNFLKSHHDMIVDDPELTEAIDEVNGLVQDKFEEMEKLLNSTLCMTQYFSGMNTF